MHTAKRQGSAGRRLSGALLMLSAGLAMAQQQPAPPLIKGVNGSETVPAPAQETKPETISAVKPKTMQEMVYGGQVAMSGVSEQKGKLGDEGVKIHGHWTIDVKNPDGTLASHHDFENSVQFGGQVYLLSLMAGYAVPADYEIFLQNNGSGNAPCVNTSTSYQGCAIVRTAATQPGISSCTTYLCGTGLSSAFNLSFTASSSMVLSGQITANQAGSINYVSTYAGSCPGNPAASPTLATTTPAACPAASANLSGFNALTGTPLAAPISVAQGQVISVTVTISFS